MRWSGQAARNRGMKNVLIILVSIVRVSREDSTLVNLRGMWWKGCGLDSGLGCDTVVGPHELHSEL
jgi:hypothetical protein